MSPHEHSPPPAAGPTRDTGRIPGPDLARGIMLLLIVLANTTFYLYGRPSSPAGVQPADGSTADRIVQALLITMVDLRVYPMFAFLFGYGLVLIHRSRQNRGLDEPAARRQVQRRNLLLLAFGAVHALLRWGGDVLGAYGLTGLLLVWLFLRRSDRTLLAWAGAGTGLLLALTVLVTLDALAVLAGERTPGDPGSGLFALARASVSAEDPLQAAAARMTMWPVMSLAIQGLVGMVVPVSILLGIWAARRRVLERPWEHRRLLWTTAVAGIAVGWAGAAPQALTHVGLLDGLVPVMGSFTVPHLLTGLACGLGYVAVFGLVGGRLVGRPLGPAGSAVVAVGSRSMTCYLAQSVICAPLLAAWGLGWGARLSSAGMATFAVGVWLVTVAYAVALERRSRTGPAEALLRRLTEGRPRAVGGS